MITLSPAQFMAAIATAWGTGILLSGPSRFVSPSFETIAAIAPWWFWGGFLISYAVLVLLTQHKPWFWFVVLLGGVPYAFIVITYLIGALETPTQSFVGVSLYTVMWMIHVGMAATYFLGRVQNREWYKERVGKL
jgi:hypothetical protein